MATQHHIVLAGSLFDPKANSSDSRELSASSGFAATLSAASSWFYRPQHRQLNLKSRLPDATEDDISFVPQTLLGLA